MPCPGADAIIDLPITQAQRDSSSNTAIIRRMVRSDAMGRAFAAAYEVNPQFLTKKTAGSPLALKNQGDSLDLLIMDYHQRGDECCHKVC
jgi:hypothetical protein